MQLMKSGCEGLDTPARRSIELPVLAGEPSQKSPVKHSKMGKWRAASLIALTLLMVIHFVQWRVTGETVSPIEPSETMYTLQRGAINAGFIFFTLAILATLVLGRFVCGWGCHIVALQDFCAWLMKKIGIRPRPFRSRLLIFVPLIAALYMFVWPTAVRYFAKPPGEPLFPQFTNHLITTNFWETFPPVFVAIPFLFICGFVTVYFLGSKGFCTYACPYGGFFGVADKFAAGRIRVTDACNECGHCTSVCTSNVIVHSEVKQYGMVVDPGCMKCMDCVSVCPNDALYFGFGKPPVLVRAPTYRGNEQGPSLKKNYSLTWPEEILAAVVFGASLLAVWDVYQLVPMLMALGIAAVTTFLVVRLVKLARTQESTFLKYLLRSSGNFTRAGWIFAAFAAIWIGLVAHSGWIRYHERMGAEAYQRVQIPDELALARPNPKAWLSAIDKENIAAGRVHLQTAYSNGLLTNEYALPKLAWMEYFAGDTEQAIKLLAAASAIQHGQTRALSLYYRGVMLNRLKRYDEALTSLDAAIVERPDLATAREERGEALWQLGRRDEAVAVWNKALNDSPSLVLAHYLLAGAAASDGRVQEASALEHQAEAATPADALFHWMIGMRLQNIGMRDLAEKSFQRAITLNPEFRRARELDMINRQ
jgi:polyferredoxin/tetratricopeptide (TPR) repeat protein